LKDILSLFEKPKDTVNFDAIRIRLASPERIRAWSFGEVTKPETINYRTFKPERGGLFCAKIFGPTKDWECNCGKFKRMKHRGVVCDKCGVEVIQSKVRRERLGHIELASPVSHIWFFKVLPSKIGQILDMSLRELEKILYFEMYVVLDPGGAPVERGELVDDDKYQELRKEHGSAFKAGMGAVSIRELLRTIDPEQLAQDLRRQYRDATSEQKQKKITKRLKVVDAFRKSGNLPEWMILDVIPVIPPELRPLVPLDGGRFATSDLNDLYRRVINRNNRLKRLIDLRAPEVIIRNEKRMLQEAVDALFDNGKLGKTIKGPNNRPLRSLSDMMRGKQGRFRQNLLGKRVDYSGRSVIVVGPDLKLHQCGLPKKMALEIFKPLIFNKLEERGLVSSIKMAKKMVESESPEVWAILEEVVQEHPVLLNRAPTLHRLGIQAFQPVLVEGKAIKIHPLVCTAFNADFDGDQMAVHLPLSLESQIESHLLMMSTNNVLSPANGQPTAVPSQDIVLGCYYLTKARKGDRGEGKIFADPDEAILAYDTGAVALQAIVKVRIGRELIETTPGRVIFNSALPAAHPYFNGEANKKALRNLVADVYNSFGQRQTVLLLDRLKEMGFKYATIAGISICIDDMQIPAKKSVLINRAQEQVIEIEREYLEGVITNGERYNKVIDVWSHVTEQVADEMFKMLERGEGAGPHRQRAAGEFNPIYMMADSGSRGSKQQIRQLAGMRGLMTKPSGEIIETPITANFREGLNVLQYFISTHGARKGLADTSLKTADSGYLTRRLVEVAHDVIITNLDCGTMDGIHVTAIVEGGEIIEPLKDRILGRVALDDVYDPFTGDLILEANQEITSELGRKIEEAGLERVKIRSVLTCEAEHGVCARCYGRNLATGHMVDLGEAVGVIAAQSIGEPGTQLTMRTFHIGGAASRIVEQSKLENKFPGIVRMPGLDAVRGRDGDFVVMNRNAYLIVEDKDGREKERYKLVYGAKLKVKDGQEVTIKEDPPHSKVKHGEILAEWDPYTNVILAEKPGTVRYDDITDDLTLKEEFDEISGKATRVIVESSEHKELQPKVIIRGDKGKEISRHILPSGAHLVVQNGDEIEAGDVIAKIPRETTKTKDITGGLPRVVELFEARKPKEHAIISEINGYVKEIGFEKGQRKVVIANEADERSYFLPRGAHINVYVGDRVRAGEALMDGSSNPHDILKVLGDKELQKYLVSEIQEVYRLQGVNINDKHIEVIVRQMLRQVRVNDPGDTEFLQDQQVNKWRFRKENERIVSSVRVGRPGDTRLQEGQVVSRAELNAENERVRGSGKKQAAESSDEQPRPANASPLLLGITKTSLNTDSFISAASFQETTKVLTEAAIHGKVDTLRGLKENVVVGRLIPAGTGLESYQQIRLHRTAEDEIFQSNEPTEKAMSERG
jgi:DNA-directed RNA polymerase subunit beta'